MRTALGITLLGLSAWGCAKRASPQETMETACAKGSVEHCRQIGGPTPKAVIEAYDAKCVGGDARGCRLAVGVVHAIGKTALGPNPFRPVMLMARGCQLGNEDLCVAHASAVAAARRRAGVEHRGRRGSGSE